MVKVCKECGKQDSGDSFPKAGRLCKDCKKEYHRKYMKTYVSKNVEHKISAATPVKQITLRKFVNFHLLLANAVFRRYSYYKEEYVYIDMNAGSGHIDDMDIEGSPIIFLDAAKNTILNCKHYDMKPKPYFIELIPQLADTLEARVKDRRSKAVVLSGDHDELLPVVCKKIKYNTLGLVYHDPFGDISYSVLHEVFSKSNMKRVDLLIRLNGNGIKRASKNKLQEYIKGINKTTWLIAKDGDGDKWQWGFLFGTNDSNINEYKSAGFYRLDSVEGQEILKVLNYTRKELKELGKKNMEITAWN